MFIDPSADQAINTHNFLVTSLTGPNHVYLYSDGSLTHDQTNPETGETIYGGVSGAALSLSTGDSNSINLGRPDHNNVHEGELAGVKLALDLALFQLRSMSHPIPSCSAHQSLPQPHHTPTSEAWPPEGSTFLPGQLDSRFRKFDTIFLDSQSATWASAGFPKQRAGQHLVIAAQSAARAIIEEQPNCLVSVRWVPGHKEVEGNEEVDEIAREASHELSVPPPFPQSLSSLKSLTRIGISSIERKSTRKGGNRHASIRGGSSAKQTFAMLSSLSRPMCSLVFQLRSGHCGLNSYLARFGIVDSPLCEPCAEVESVHHYFFTCQRFEVQRNDMLETLRQERQRCSTVKDLLSNPKAIKVVADFIKSTGRFSSKRSGEVREGCSRSSSERLRSPSVIGNPEDFGPVLSREGRG